MDNHTDEKAERSRLVYVNWPALWCLVFFVLGFFVGRSW